MLTKTKKEKRKKKKETTFQSGETNEDCKSYLSR